MCRDSDFQYFGREMFLESDMTAFLTDNDPAIALQRPNHLRSRRGWELCSYREFDLFCIRSECQVVVNRFYIQLNGLTNIL